MPAEGITPPVIDEVFENAVDEDDLENEPAALPQSQIQFLPDESVDAAPNTLENTARVIRLYDENLGDEFDTTIDSPTISQNLRVMTGCARRLCDGETENLEVINTLFEHVQSLQPLPDEDSVSAQILEEIASANQSKAELIYGDAYRQEVVSALAVAGKYAREAQNNEKLKFGTVELIRALNDPDSLVETEDDKDLFLERANAAGVTAEDAEKLRKVLENVSQNFGLDNFSEFVPKFDLDADEKFLKNEIKAHFAKRLDAYRELVAVLDDLGDAQETPYNWERDRTNFDSWENWQEKFIADGEQVEDLTGNEFIETKRVRFTRNSTRRERHYTEHSVELVKKNVFTRDPQTGNEEWKEIYVSRAIYHKPRWSTKTGEAPQVGDVTTNPRLFYTNMEDTAAAPHNIIDIVDRQKQLKAAHRFERDGREIAAVPVVFTNSETGKEEIHVRFIQARYVDRELRHLEKSRKSFEAAGFTYEEAIADRRTEQVRTRLRENLGYSPEGFVDYIRAERYVLDNIQSRIDELSANNENGKNDYKIAQLKNSQEEVKNEYTDFMLTYGRGHDYEDIAQERIDERIAAGEIDMEAYSDPETKAALLAIEAQRVRVEHTYKAFMLKQIASELKFNDEFTTLTPEQLDRLLLNLAMNIEIEWKSHFMADENEGISLEDAKVMLYEVAKTFMRTEVDSADLDFKAGDYYWKMQQYRILVNQNINKAVDVRSMAAHEAEAFDYLKYGYFAVDAPEGKFDPQDLEFTLETFEERFDRGPKPGELQNLNEKFKAKVLYQELLYWKEGAQRLQAFNEFLAANPGVANEDIYSWIIARIPTDKKMEIEEMRINNANAQSVKAEQTQLQVNEEALRTKQAAAAELIEKRKAAQREQAERQKQEAEKQEEEMAAHAEKVAKLAKAQNSAAQTAEQNRAAQQNVDQLVEKLPDNFVEGMEALGRDLTFGDKDLSPEIAQQLEERGIDWFYAAVALDEVVAKSHPVSEFTQTPQEFVRVVVELANKYAQKGETAQEEVASIVG